MNFKKNFVELFKFIKYKKKKKELRTYKIFFKHKPIYIEF